MRYTRISLLTDGISQEHYWCCCGLGLVVKEKNCNQWVSNVRFFWLAVEYLIRILKWDMLSAKCVWARHFPSISTRRFYPCPLCLHGAWFMFYTAASHQGAIQMFWNHFWATVKLSIFIYRLWFTMTAELRKLLTACKTGWQTEHRHYVYSILIVIHRHSKVCVNTCLWLSHSQVRDSGRGDRSRESTGSWPATQDWRQEADGE